ncbi:MAG TPA: enoyl-CoA hydratase-related protein [Rhodopila sp.]|uniref:enoyl-CoA hydratase/isomerase family protein n=1 Tax=Rhodopila sp. TaxID=2480087 RepID=UPI002D15C05D|nr:enoyl-CoA hydratase-related protein [Rhodopila sp.]HVY13694.1 enoyl-CoA hydratase-related protein [Rhodopila sp.]
MNEKRTAEHAPIVGYECIDGIAMIGLNRPDKLNALDDDMALALAAALHRFDIDPDAQVAVLHGRGRAFCSGADVRKRQLRSETELRQHGGPQAWGASANELFARGVNWKPVIAAVHGYALGLGLGITLQSDLVVAERGTKFQVTETSRGLAAARHWAMLRFRGAGSFATQITLTGRMFTAEEAFAAGVVDYLAEPGAGIEMARNVGHDIARNPPLSVRATVRTRRWYMAQAEREAFLQTDPFKLYLTEDFRESARAFAEKRPAGPFKGR